MQITITNQSRETPIADRCELARSFWARGRGLMGRPNLEPGQGLLIYPEWSIHTFFMCFPIDVLFMDRSDCVMGLRAAMPPYRPYAGVWGARYVIELPAGVIASSQTQIGDQLLVQPSPQHDFRR